jgi:hypothetical protein
MVAMLLIALAHACAGRAACRGWVLLALLMGYPALAALQEGLAQPRKQRHEDSKPARAAGRRKHA